MIKKGLLACLWFSISITAQAEGPVKSLRTAMLHEDTNKAYIAAAYPFNHEGYEEALNKLWKATENNLPKDDYGQQWKLVSITALKEIFRSIPEEYDLIWPVIKSVKKDDGTYSREFEGYRVERRKIEHAAIFEWGCDGSIIPGLNIGDWPQDASDWSPLAIPASRQSGDAKLVALDTSLIPPAYLAQMGATDQWVTIEWPDANIKATLVKRHLAESWDTYSLFAMGDYPDYFSYLKAKTPVDSRC